MKRIVKMVGCSALVLTGFIGQASAAQDWSAIGTDVTAEITAVMPVALGIFGSVLVVVIGKKVLKRLAG